MHRPFIRLGAVAGFLAVALGAFGAHGLRGRLSVDEMGIFETAARYHLIHAVALVVTGLIAERRATKAPIVAGWCFAGGIVLFSGSLYALALTGVTSFGFVTPFGGLLLLAGWVGLLFSAR